MTIYVSLGLFAPKSRLQRQDLSDDLLGICRSISPFVRAAHVPVTVSAPNAWSTFQSWGGMFCIWLSAVCLLYKCRIMGACSQVNIHASHVRTETHVLTCTNRLYNTCSCSAHTDRLKSPPHCGLNLAWFPKWATASLLCQNCKISKALHENSLPTLSALCSRKLCTLLLFCHSTLAWKLCVLWSIVLVLCRL